MGENICKQMGQEIHLQNILNMDAKNKSQLLK